MSNDSRLSLCNMLGVKPDEVFRDKRSCCDFRIHNGYREYFNCKRWIRCDDEDSLVELIADQNLITHKPQKPCFTNDELTTIKVLTDAVSWAKYIKRRANGGLVLQELGGDGPGATGRWVALPDKLFPCVLAGQTIRLQSIPNEKLVGIGGM